MISIVICEDEAYFLDHIAKLLDEYLKSKKMEACIEKFSTGEELLASARNPNIILMDIELPGLDGMKLVRLLRDNGCKAQVIFITSYRKYVFQAFDVDAIHYILKPIEPNKFFLAVDKAMKRIVQTYDRALLLTKNNLDTKVLLKDILYCEVFNHQIFIHTLYGKFSYFGTLSSLEKQLDNQFFRCHRSYIVNMSYVTFRENEIISIVGGSKLLLSRRKKQEFERRLLEICRREGLP